MKNFIVLALVLVFNACTFKQGADNGKILSLKDETTRIVKFNELLNPISVIPLDNNLVCTYKWISKVLSFDGKLYVLGGMETDKLCVFNSDGSFVKQIGETGHGNGEFINAADFAIDETNKRIAILEAPYKIHIYDLDGKHLFTKELKDAVLWKLVWVKGRYICTTANYSSLKDKLLYVYTDEFKLVDKYVDVLPFTVGAVTTITNPLQTNGEAVNYIDNVTKSIYLYSNGDAQKSYSFELPNPMPIKNYKTNLIFGEAQHNYDFILDAVVTKSSILVSYVHNGEVYAKLLSSNGKDKVCGHLMNGLPNMFKGNDDFVYLGVTARDYLKNEEKCYPKTKTKVMSGDNFLLVKCRLR